MISEDLEKGTSAIEYYASNTSNDILSQQGNLAMFNKVKAIGWFEILL